VTRRKFRKIGYLSFGLFAALMASLSLVLSFLDWNQYRDTLSMLASEQMGLRVELTGNVTLTLFPRPSMSAESVRIAPASGENADQVATAEKIEMHLGFVSFLKGKIAIQSLDLEGLNVAVEQSEKGVWQIKGWPESDAENSPIDLSRLGISNGRLLVTPYGGLPRLVEGLDLKFSGALPEGPLEWAGAFSLDGQNIQTEGRLRPISVREEISIKTDIRLAGSALSISGRLAENGNITARLVAEGRKLGDTLEALSVIFGEEKGAGKVPNIPFSLDMQFDQHGNIAKLISRNFTLADTRGRVDLTLARRENYSHMAGTVSLGVIDLDVWRAAQKDTALQTEKISPHQDTPYQIKLGGAVDLTIEGVRMQGGLGQRIDAVIAFGGDGPMVTSFQALLPGAATLAFTGELKAGSGHGKARIDIGNVGDLTQWVGLDIPDAISAGRMSTAFAEASLDYKGGVWELRDIKGHVDTSSVGGELSGDFSSFLPLQAKLKIDNLNLDAFTFADDNEADGIAGPALRIPDDIDIRLDIMADSLHGFGTSLGKARFVGMVEAGKLDIEFVELKHGAGSLRAEGSLANLGDDLAIELAANFNAWPMPIAKYFVPDLQRYLVAANIDGIDGTASVTGVQSKMRLGLDAATGKNSASLSGEVGFPQGRLSFVDLQGGFKHENLAGPARLAGIGDYRNLPAQLTFSFSKAGPGQIFQARIGGDLAEGKMQADIGYFDQLQSITVSFDHENISRLAALTGARLKAFDSTKGIRAEITAIREDGGWSFEIPSLKNGKRSISGAINLRGDNRFQGQLSLSEIDLGAAGGPSQDFGGKTDTSELLRKLADYGGSLLLSLDSIRYAGQNISAPKASVSVGDGSARFLLGVGAAVNEKPASMQVDAVLDGVLPFNGRANIQALDLAGLLTSEGISNVVTATLAGDLSIAGEFAGEKGLMASLKGNGSFAGDAGQLKFLSAGALQAQMKTAKTGSGFLARIGGLLRRGETPFSTLKARFALDGGVMLVETAEVNGDWGKLALDGQINLIDRFLNMKGALALSDPVDTPPIPVRFEGPLQAPASHWASRAFESFAISGVQRRLRSTLMREMEARQAEGGVVSQNPGVAVFARAFDLLGQLKERQEKKKRLEAEAALKADEAISPAIAAQKPG